MKVLSIFGTRPEAIKMAPVISALEDDSLFESVVCVTAQHRDMLDQVLDFFDIVPAFDLDLMRVRQDLPELTSAILLGLGPVLDDCSPDLVLVHGDTCTTMAAALASYYKKTRIGHVEAGLRTGNLYSPWPEESNRKIVGVLADWHFAPTERAKSNLLLENIHPEKIVVTGNTVIDALLAVSKRLEGVEDTGFFGGQDFRFLKDYEKVVLITGHRRESFGSGIKNLCDAIFRLANEMPTTCFVYPVHLNPNVQGPVYGKLGGIKNIRLLPPLDYFPFIYLMKNSSLILTDSGGIQEEGPSLGKPVLVTREYTERPEAVDAGTVKLVGTNKEKIVEWVTKLLTNPEEYERMSRADNPYGDGKAAGRIVSALRNSADFC